MHRSRNLSAVLAVVVLAALLPAVALAAAPLLVPAKNYATKGYRNGVSVSFVTSAGNAKKIEPGGAPLGAQFAVGGIYVRCPSAPRSTSTSATPFTGIPFPAIRLRLSHGSYGFAKTLRVSQSILASSLGKPVKLTVHFTGTVRNPKLITGTVKVAGPKCATTATYAAHERTFAVAPGQ